MEKTLQDCSLVFIRLNWTDLIDVLHRNNSSLKKGDSVYHRKEQWFSVAISVICVFGILGNILNLLVLASHRITSRLDHIGHSVNNGLKALAVSDMLFCVFVFPHSFITTEYVEVVGKKEAYVLYYRLYAVGLINFCQMTSTWLVVIMACSRYWGIRRPLHARNQIWTRHMNILITVVFVFSLFICLPYFLSQYVKAICMHQGEQWYHLEYLFSERHRKSMYFYLRWIWGIFANFIPTALLIMCNICLVRELSVVYNQRDEVLQTSENKKSHRIVTVTIINIIILSLLFVAPAEILRYIDPVIKWGETGHTITLVANVFQTVNFAVNFGLYCVVNIHFRTTVKSWLFGIPGLWKKCCCYNTTGLSPSSSLFTSSLESRRNMCGKNCNMELSCQTECESFVGRNSVKKFLPNKANQNTNHQRVSLL